MVALLHQQHRVLAFALQVAPETDDVGVLYRPQHLGLVHQAPLLLALPIPVALVELLESPRGTGSALGVGRALKGVDANTC